MSHNDFLEDMHKNDGEEWFAKLEDEWLAKFRASKTACVVCLRKGEVLHLHHDHCAHLVVTTQEKLQYSVSVYDTARHLAEEAATDARLAAARERVTAPAAMKRRRHSDGS